MLSQTNSEKKWEAVRSAFALDPSYIHLALGMLTSHPLEVRKAIAHHRDELDRNPAIYYRQKDAFETQILAKAASYLKTNPQQIALTESTTMGLATVYHGLCMEEGDEILTTLHEHYASLETLRFKEKKEKVRVIHISLYEEPGTVKDSEVISRIFERITKRTRLIALTWVHSCTGVKLPIQEIGQALALINQSRSEKEKILLSIDGLHSLGVEDISIENLGCDFFIAGCHKWLFGPRGTGLIWGSQAGWRRMNPTQASFKKEAFFSWFNRENLDANCPKAWQCSPGGFQAYEHRWALGEAFDFHLLIGKTAITERIHELSSYCKKQINSLPRVHLYTPLPSSLSSGMVCFKIEGMQPHIVVEKLLEKKIVSGQTPYHETLCRFTPGIFNTHEDINLAAQALEEILK